MGQEDCTAVTTQVFPVSCQSISVTQLSHLKVCAIIVHMYTSLGCVYIPMCFIKTACTLAFTVPPPHHFLSVELMPCCYSVLQSFISHINTVYPAPLNPPHTLSFFPHPLSSTPIPTLSTPCIRTSSSTPPLYLQILSSTFPTTLTISFFSFSLSPPIPTIPFLHMCVSLHTAPYGIVSFIHKSVTTTVKEQTVNPVWSQTVVLNDVIMYGPPEHASAFMPPVWIEFFDKDVLVSCNRGRGGGFSM